MTDSKSPTRRDGVVKVVPSADMEDDQLLVDAILDDILDHIAVDVACEMHHAIKMGKLKEGPKRRLDLYSDLYSTEEQMLESITKYSTEEPLQKRRTIAPMTDQDTLLDLDDPDEDDTIAGSTMNSASATIHPPTPTTSTAVVTTRHQQNLKDIWNRFPLKEPKTLARCTICDREVSVLRFAPHLDKCMQLGTVRGAASNTAAASAVAASGSMVASNGRNSAK